MLFLLLLQFNSPFKIKETNKPILYYNLVHSLFKGQNKIIKTTQVGKLPLEIINTKVIKHRDNAPTQHLLWAFRSRFWDAQWRLTPLLMIGVF